MAADVGLALAALNTSRWVRPTVYNVNFEKKNRKLERKRFVLFVSVLNVLHCSDVAIME